MDTYTTSKVVFLDQVRTDHAAWQALIASIPDERLAEPGAVGHWSVKDTIAHISVYERWTIDWLKPALSGNPPEWDENQSSEGLSMDEQNAVFWEQNRDRSLQDIQKEASSTHAELLTLIESIPEDTATAPLSEFAPDIAGMWGPGVNVLDALDGNTAEHYREHTNDVRQWLND